MSNHRHHVLRGVLFTSLAVGISSVPYSSLSTELDGICTATTAQLELRNLPAKWQRLSEAVESAPFPPDREALGAMATKPERRAAVAGLITKSATQEQVTVIVQLNQAYSFEPNLEKLSDGATRVAKQRQRLAKAQQEVVDALSGRQTGVNSFIYTPFVSMRVDQDDLDRLMNHPLVADIQENHVMSPTLLQSVPVIHANELWPPSGGGYTGTGQAVAILDTGVDITHPFFKNGDIYRVLATSACFSNTDQNPDRQSLCLNGEVQEIGPLAGNALSDIYEDYYHGTMVAGIVAGSDVLNNIAGVAPVASIISIQIASLEGASSSNCSSSTPCSVDVTTVDQIKGLEYVYSLRNSHSIAAVNMSLGGDKYLDQASCDKKNACVKAQIDLLRAAGIATIIASGNKGYTDGFAAPACISTAISVGATWDETRNDWLSDLNDCSDDPGDNRHDGNYNGGDPVVDEVGCYTESAAFLDLLAPGSLIKSSRPGGIYEEGEGTSLAAPHVAGCWAVLKQAVPSASVSEIKAALINSGALISDWRYPSYPVITPRIDCKAALAKLRSGSGGTATTRLNDTGIKTCSNATQNGLPCPVAGFPGQDAEYGTNSFNFTKLDANGNAMPVTATNHVCVKDNATGLMWEVKTDDGGLRDKDWVYSWFFNNSGYADYHDNCYNSSRCDTEKFVQDVNATNLCGHNDWRVPNPHELVSIVDYSMPYPGSTIDTDYFPNSVSKWFWTNYPVAAYSCCSSWIVGFHGHVQGSARTSDDAVRLVRGGQSLLSFVNNNNGTITDQNTGLMWAKCSQGQNATDCSDSARYLTWQQALQAADTSTLAGYSDWRVPNVKELQSLADYTVSSPAISSSYFPNIGIYSPNIDFFDYNYWTSSAIAFNSPYLWSVNFEYGGVSKVTRYAGCAVRLVRGGQSSPPTVTITAPTPQALHPGNRLTLRWTTQNAQRGDAIALDMKRKSATGLTQPDGLNWYRFTPSIGSTNDGAEPILIPNGLTVANDWQFIVRHVKSNAFAATPAASPYSYSYALPSQLPQVTTNPAANPTATTADLKGTVTPSSTATTVEFNLGRTTCYGIDVPATPGTISATASTTAVPAVAVTARRTGLTCNTLYHYRVTANNSAGTSLGADQSFKTAPCPTKDFVVTGITFTPAAPVANGTFKATVTVKNQGNTTGDGKFIDVWSHQPTNQACGAVGNQRQTIGTLAAGATKVLTFPSLLAGTAGSKMFRAFIDSGCGTTESNESNNQSTAVYPVNQATNVDLVVVSVNQTPVSPAVNSIFSASVTVKNQGTVAGVGNFVDVWSHQPNGQACGAVGNMRQTVGVLAAGAFRTLTFAGLNAGAAGSKMLRAFVDSGCGTAENNEGNNQGTTLYSVNQNTGVDFVVLNPIILTPTAPTANGTLSAIITVKNQGTVAGDGKFLDVWSHQPSGQACGAVGNQRQAVGALPVGATKTLTFTNNLPAGIAGTKMLRAFVDSGCGTGENNEGNNQFTKSYTVQ